MNKFVKSMLSLALAGSMVATVVPGVAMGETLDTKYVDLTGTMSGDLNARGRFYADYSSLDEALEAGNRLHLQMASEGQVLLKNEMARCRWVPMSATSPSWVLAPLTTTVAAAAPAQPRAPAICWAGMMLSSRPGSM